MSMDFSDKKTQRIVYKLLFNLSYDNVFSKIEKGFSQYPNAVIMDNYRSRIIGKSLLDFLKFIGKDILFEEMYLQFPYLLISFILFGLAIK